MTASAPSTRRSSTATCPDRWIARRRQPRPRRTRASSSSWYVAGAGAPASELEKARDSHRRRGAQLPRQRAGLLRRGARARPRSRRSTPPTAGSTTSPTSGRRSTPGTATAASAREFFLGVDDHLLDFGERVARDLASADVSASLTRVYSLERAAARARTRGERVHRGARQRRAAGLQRVGRCAGRAGRSTSPRSATPRPSTSSAPSPTVLGARAGPQLALPAVVPRAPRRRRPSTTSTTSARARRVDRAIDSVVDVINPTADVQASAALREVRTYGGLAVVRDAPDARS